MCFVVTNLCLSQETHVCGAKTFVATKMVLVAAPGNDSEGVVCCNGASWC